MPRMARKSSESSIYHVIQRGVGKQILFEDDEDRTFYLAMARRFAEDQPESDPILAWCLMSNHVHLLLHMELSELSRFMKRLGTTYARYFNERHSRAGHLFQDRFRSEPVDDDAYLITVVIYIHLNPVGLECTEPDGYRWSSYGEYVGSRRKELASTSFVLDVFGGMAQFEAIHREGIAGRKPLPAETTATRPRNDQEALELAKEELGDIGIHELKGMPKAERDRHIAALRGRGLSVRQVARITGIGASIVARARGEANGESGQ